ncbi:MAG: glycerate kinase [Luteolibacter sp.]
MPRRFLIAPDKFKGSLTASQAADAMAAGVRQVFPDAEIDLCPIADGGEGFMETLAPTLNARWITCPAVDSLGRAIQSRYLIADTPAGPNAILEMAETAGLWRLTTSERNPLLVTTRGTGLQIAHAIKEHAVTRIILGLGGSATNDGGCGMAAALGIVFHGKSGVITEPNPSKLLNVKSINLESRLVLPEIIAACDVKNPLLGPEGATAVFSRQKGASDDDRILLEAALAHLVSITGGDAAALTPGAGAAGGLGFGLLHFTGAKMHSGFDILADLLDLKSRIAAVDQILTGEGSLDQQSLSGKGPVALARMARSLGKPTTAYCGLADDSARNSGIFQQVHNLADSKLPLETRIAQAAPLLTGMVAESLRGRYGLFHDPNRE